MRPLADREILDVWEQGQGLAPVARALVMLAPSSGGAIDAMARLPVGHRDGRLLRLRAETFGPRLDGLADCPSCGECLDVGFLTEEILVNGPDEAAVLVKVGDYQVEARLPTGSDLIEVLAVAPGDDSRTRLLARCVTGARLGDAPVPADAVPDEVLSAVEDALAAADPQAEVLLELSCPSCGHEWCAPFDIVAFFWSEIGTRATQILGEIHRLASAYGWSEREILGLAPIRRRAYLEMVGE